MATKLSQQYPKTAAFFAKAKIGVSAFLDKMMPYSHDNLAFAGIGRFPAKKPDPTRILQKEKKLSKEEQTEKQLRGPMHMMSGGKEAREYYRQFYAPDTIRMANERAAAEAERIKNFETEARSRGMTTEQYASYNRKRHGCKS